VILQVSFEAPIGTRRDSRSLQLRGVEEVTVAAPRIADAMVHGTPIGQSAHVGNLVGEETRGYRKQYGEMLAAIGLIGFAYPGDTWSGYGFYGRLHYEAQHYAIGIDLRLGGSSDGAGDAALAGISLGARYFFTEEDITPFVSGGAGIMWIGLRHEYASTLTSDARLSGSGLAGFGDVGMEFMRLHESRFDVLARLDVPFFDLEATGHHRYTMPFSIMASFSF
jgi:hypothetical protein